MDPVREEIIHQAQLEKKASNNPICEICKNPITDEYYISLTGYRDCVVHKNCLHDALKYGTLRSDLAVMVYESIEYHEEVKHEHL